MIVLVIGREGQVAKSLAGIPQRCGMQVVCMGRPMLDLRNPASILAALQSTKPDVVINAGAFTAVDRAESEAKLAFAINADGPAHLGAACAQENIPVIHLSTDYVYDGRKPSPYVESDPVGPANVYGASKLGGEERLAAANPRHLIVRTGWVHSPFGQNFVKTMLKLGFTHPEIGVVDDQRGNPTYANHLAEAILSIAKQIAGAPAIDPRFGVYHAVNTGETSWCGLAQEVFRQTGARGFKLPQVKPITTAEFPTPANRPANSRLNSSKLRQAFGVALPSWQQGVSDCIEQIAHDTGGTFIWWRQEKNAPSANASSASVQRV